MINFVENNLVLIRLNNNISGKYKQPHYNVWLRVLFIDNDNTLIGEIERFEQGLNKYSLGDKINILSDKILDVFDINDGQQWCYSDGVTRCSCSGLCRNK